MARGIEKEWEQYEDNCRVRITMGTHCIGGWPDNNL